MNVRRLLFLIAASALLPGTGLQAQLPAHYKTTVFDPQGSVYTYACAQNLQGAVAGFYVDSQDVWHGFVRHPDGVIEPIDIPGAGTDGTYGQGTNVTFINEEGTTCGCMQDKENNCHAFFRTASGQVTLFDDPAAVPAPLFPGFTNTIETEFQGISDLGLGAGAYNDANGLIHQFVRTVFGYTVNADPPGAVNGIAWWGFRTVNPLGMVAGAYYDAAWNDHGYVLNPDGTFVMTDPPGATNAQPYDITPLGTTTGWWTDSMGTMHGYVRTMAGAFTTMDFPGLPNLLETVGCCSNDLGVAGGDLWVGPAPYSRGFLRSPDGKYQLVDAILPMPTGQEQGTRIHGISDSGQIMGNVVDGNGTQHAYVMVPAK